VPEIEHFQFQGEDDRGSPETLSVSTRESTASTRDSSPDYRLEVMSMCTSSSISPLPPTFPLSPTPPDSPVRKTPISADSPLLSKAPTDPARKRVRSFTKNLRRARSFRASREKSVDKVNYEEVDLRGQEVTFLIKKSLSGRIGWKIMPEEEELNLKINPAVLQQVMDQIRDLQFSGQVIPDKISLKIE